MIKYNIPLFQHLSWMLLNVKLICFFLLFSARNEHCFVRSINFKSNCHFFSDFVWEILLIFQLLILIIGILFIYQVIEYLTRIGHVVRFTIFKLYFHLFRKPLGQKHPNTISVQFKGLSKSGFNKILTVIDNVTANICHHGCSLHGIPSWPFSHDIPIKTIQNNFMSQLHRFEQLHKFYLFFLLFVFSFLGFLGGFSFVDFGERFIFISAISESSYCINIKWILSHTYSVSANFANWNMTFGVDFLAILFYFAFECFFLLNFIIIVGIWLQSLFLFNQRILSLVQGEIFSLPLPLQASLAIIFWGIEQASWADTIIDNCNRLQAVGNNDVGVHGCDVNVID